MEKKRGEIIQTLVKPIRMCYSEEGQRFVHFSTSRSSESANIVKYH